MPARATAPVPPRAAPLPPLSPSLRAARAALACGFALLYGTLSLLRYRTFHSRSLDMAFYVRLVWGMGHGRPDNPIVGAPHWLGLHLEPALLPLAALCRAGLPVAETLLVVQALGAALALLPAHRMARRHLAPVVGERAALVAAACVYLLPSVSRGVDYDFHPITPALFPLLAFVEALDAGRLGAAWAWGAAALCFREDIGLQIAAAAGARLLFTKAISRREGARFQLAAMALAGAAWFFGYALLVQPRFLPAPEDGSLGAHFARFGGGAGGVFGVVTAILADPAAAARHLVSGDRLGYLPLLLSTTGLLALAAPVGLFGLLPIVFINLLSDFAGVRGVQSHYAVATVPFLVGAALVGAARLAAVLPARRALRLAPVAVLLLASGAWFWLRGCAPGAPDFALDSYREDAFARAAAAEVRAVGDAPRAVAEVRLLAHLAERPEPLLDPAQRHYWRR